MWPYEPAIAAAIFISGFRGWLTFSSELKARDISGTPIQCPILAGYIGVHVLAAAGIVAIHNVLCTHALYKTALATAITLWFLV
jgi:hypothetical protein